MIVILISVYFPQSIEQEIDLHREQMSSIDILATKLKSKVDRSATYIAPLRTEVAKRFEELQIDVEDKTARLNEATRGYMKVQKAVDELSSLLDDAEVTAETCSSLEADESFEDLEVCVYCRVRLVENSLSISKAARHVFYQKRRRKNSVFLRLTKPYELHY